MAITGKHQLINAQVVTLDVRLAMELFPLNATHVETMELSLTTCNMELRNA